MMYNVNDEWSLSFLVTARRKRRIKICIERGNDMRKKNSYRQGVISEPGSSQQGSSSSTQPTETLLKKERESPYSYIYVIVTRQIS